VLAASDTIDAAIEGDVLVGQGSPSTLSRHLVEGLETRKADLNDDGRITVDELYSYARQRISGESRTAPMFYGFKCKHELVIGYDPGRLNPGSLGLYLSEKRRALVIANSGIRNLVNASLSECEATTKAFVRVLKDPLSVVLPLKRS
jgi:hypothetical protein